MPSPRYIHPSNNPENCPCAITDKDRCRNKGKDIEPVTHDPMEELDTTDLVIMPSGHCILKESLAALPTWIDLMGSQAPLSTDNEFCATSAACRELRRQEQRDRQRPQARQRQRQRQRQRPQDPHILALIHDHQELAARPEMQERFRQRELQQNRGDRMNTYRAYLRLACMIIIELLKLGFYVTSEIINTCILFFSLLYQLGFRGNLILGFAIFAAYIIEGVIVIGPIDGIREFGEALGQALDWFNMLGGGGGRGTSPKKSTVHPPLVKSLYKYIKMADKHGDLYLYNHYEAQLEKLLELKLTENLKNLIKEVLDINIKIKEKILKIKKIKYEPEEIKTIITALIPTPKRSRRSKSGRSKSGKSKSGRSSRNTSRKLSRSLNPSSSRKLSRSLNPSSSSKPIRSSRR